MSDHEMEEHVYAEDETNEPVDEDQDQQEEPRRSLYDDDEEEDEEEEEEEPDSKHAKKRAKHKHKRAGVARFLDDEAEVSDDDEEEEEEEDYEPDGFIATAGDEDEGGRRSHNALLDRRMDDMADQDLDKLAQDLTKRYSRPAVRYTGDMNEVPQRLLMPSVQDANLWQVRVKPGRERDIVFSLMRKSIDVEYTARPLQILSAFQRDSLPGMIYVEARSSQQVSLACNGLVGVYPSRGVVLVPIEEMSSLLQIKKQDLTVKEGSWVRIKRGKYQGDLAQVVDTTDNGEEVGLKLIPRVDLNPRDDGVAGADGKKRKKGAVAGASATMRPPQRFFNYEEVVKVYGRKHVAKRNQVYVFQNDTYKDGFIEKDFRITALSLENVDPTLDEVSQFTRGQHGMDGGESAVDLSVIAEASRKAAVSVLQPGDHIEVFEGEQSGVHGVVEEIVGDVVTITAVGVDVDGQKIDIPARSVRKRFKAGDHVKVMTGQNADETGLVVSVADHIVTFLSDMSLQEVSVFSKDLREAAEVGSGTNIVGDYELHDLVQLDLQTVGVIFKTERDSFRVLDQNGQVRLVQPHQISMRRSSNRAIATDASGRELRINDNMEETDGEGRKGRVLHVHQSFFAFLHNRDILENGGVFVTRARSLQSQQPKGGGAGAAPKAPVMDLSKMKPTPGMDGGMVGSGNMGRGPRDRLIGVTVVVVKGPHKGYVGAIKDTNGNVARVELHTGNKVVTVEKDKLRRRGENGKIEPLESGFGNMGPPRMGGGMFSHASSPAQGSFSMPTPANGGRTPAWGNTGRTPNPYGESSRTPAWTASSRTPNPYADNGGKTPAWNASSRTPNPYANAGDGGKTPAWNSSSRTPNPYASGNTNSSSTTWGGATPGRAPASSSTTWGGATPGRNASAWGSTSDSFGGGGGWSANAPTPGAASWSPPAEIATPAFMIPIPSIPFGGYPSTPAAFAATPANDPLYTSNEQQEYDPPTEWLLDPALLNPDTGIIRPYKVQVQGTRGRYRDGAYENKVGHVKAVFDPRGEHGKDSSLEPTASVVFDSGQPAITMVIRYLVPVAPAQNRCSVVVLETRMNVKKGDLLIVQDLEKDSKMCTVSKPQHTYYLDIAKDVLATLYLD